MKERFVVIKKFSTGPIFSPQILLVIAVVVIIDDGDNDDVVAAIVASAAVRSGGGCYRVVVLVLSPSSSLMMIMIRRCCCFCCCLSRPDAIQAFASPNPRRAFNSFSGTTPPQNRCTVNHTAQLRLTITRDELNSPPRLGPLSFRLAASSSKGRWCAGRRVGGLDPSTICALQPPVVGSGFGERGAA